MNPSAASSPQPAHRSAVLAVLCADLVCCGAAVQSFAEHLLVQHLVDILSGDIDGDVGGLQE